MVRIADAELVARSRRRDADAFGVLVERHQRLVFGVALARCQDPALAEDLAQEAFVAAWRDLDRLRDVDRVGSWVAGIARNLASSAARDRARRQIDPPALADVPTPATPEDQALEREDRELLHRALADVPDTHREALVLYYLEGESVAAIAAALGIREDLVKQRLSRGRRALRDNVAARVESALTRARLRPAPALRLGVLAALTSLGTREAAATTGKALAIMSTQKMILAAVIVLAIGGGAIWLGTRAGAGDAPRSTPSAATPAPATERPTAASPTAPRPPNVRKLDSPTARTALLESIRQRAQHKQEPPPAGAGAPEPSQAESPPPTLPDDGVTEKQYIRAAVKAIIPQLLECYETGLARDPKIAGQLVVDFTIEGEPGVGGVVGKSVIDPETSTLSDPTVRECIQETMYALEIDPPASGGVIRVHYPFVFSATGDSDATPAR